MESKRARRIEQEAIEKDASATYDAFKEYEGRRYTGMKIGRSHKWNYDPGVWKETKVTPDEWQIEYAVTKRRAGHAPEGSGVPVGTGYHWYILAHQNVTKLNANEYSTSLTGMKFKLAHKRADKDTWSASPQAQRRHLIKILKQVIEDLEQGAAVDSQPSIDGKPSADGKPDRVRARGSASRAVARQRKLPLNGRTRATAKARARTKKPTRSKARHSHAA